VVVIENDDWIARLLEEGLNDAGYEVTLASEALEGFQRACEKLPDCIICDVALPDFDGYWVAHKVRADASAISTTPFLFLTQADDEASPLEAFNVGADVQLTKPFRLDEVVAQVGALVEMAKRLRKTRDSFLDKKLSPRWAKRFAATWRRCRSPPCWPCSRWNAEAGSSKFRKETARADRRPPSTWQVDLPRAGRSPEPAPVFSRFCAR